MELFQPKYYAADDKSDDGLSLAAEDGSLFGWFDEFVEISFLGPFHGDIVVVFIFEGEDHFGDEVGSDFFHNIFL